MRRATGGGATTSTTTIYEGADEAEGDTPYENPFVPAVGARCRHRRPQEPSGARLRVEADRPDCSTMASKRPESGVWPSDLEGQADVLRWLFWESAHWDAEFCGMVAFEKGSKDVLGLGPPDPAFIARGEQNFNRFAAVLNDSLKGKTWVVGNRLTIADFSIGGLLPTAERLELGGTRLRREMPRWRRGSPRGRPGDGRL